MVIHLPTLKDGKLSGLNPASVNDLLKVITQQWC